MKIARETQNIEHQNPKLFYCQRLARLTSSRYNDDESWYIVTAQANHVRVKPAESCPLHAALQSEDRIELAEQVKSKFRVRAIFGR